MKFFCEYCGCRIDAEIDTKCPNCGASYKKNKTFIELEQKKQENQEFAEQIQKETYNHVKNTFKVSKYVSLFITIIAILIFCFIFFSMFSIGSNQTEKNSFKSTTTTVNEASQNSSYKLEVVSFKTVEDIFNELDDDYEYIEFSLTLQNLSGKELIREDVECIVDGIAQTNKSLSGVSTLPMLISKDLTVKGTATFAVPKYATGYDIKYGDDIVVHVDKKQ